MVHVRRFKQAAWLPPVRSSIIGGLSIRRFLKMAVGLTPLGGAVSPPRHTDALHSATASAAASTGVSWSPGEAFPWLVGGLACAILITQFFEYAVIATLYRLQWHRSKTHQELSLLFYQAYWGSALFLLFGSLMWLYLTDRWAYKAIYGLLVFVVVQALQLSVAILLTSWKDMAETLETQLQRPWMQSLVGKASVTQKTVAG